MTIYFYKVWQPYGCFSNFSLHEIKIKGIHWLTVEHYYQAQKFEGTKDAVIIPVIHAAETPELAAALGRDRTRQVRLDWEVVKVQVMREAVLEKFLTHTDIREVLLGTGNEILVEDSPNDCFWGCGADKTGQNHLGKTLMYVREQIRELLFLSKGLAPGVGE
ncbi:MAG: NADAR domain-containing protein [Rhizonema sp. NSF051]|nr:NADAR domain-containing protein [Rhizonema sp. NSF051]